MLVLGHHVDCGYILISHEILFFITDFLLLIACSQSDKLRIIFNHTVESKPTDLFMIQAFVTARLGLTLLTLHHVVQRWKNSYIV